MEQQIKFLKNLSIGDVLEDRKGDKHKIINITSDGSLNFLKNYMFFGFCVNQKGMSKFFSGPSNGAFFTYN